MLIQIIQLLPLYCDVYYHECVLNVINRQQARNHSYCSIVKLYAYRDLLIFRLFARKTWFNILGRD